MSTLVIQFCMDLLQLYEHQISRALADGPPPRRTPLTLRADEPGPPPKLAWSGFYPNRWVAYCDDYLGGGPVMDAWLRRPRATLLFENGAHHTRGACVTSLVVRAGALHLHSRACNWVPVGVLDLKLLWMAWTRLGVSRAEWVVDDVAFDPATVISYHRWRSLGGGSRFRERALAVADDTPAEMLDKRRAGMLGRHKKAVRRSRALVVSDESHIADAFTLAVPRDFVWESGGAIRESWVTRVVGRRGYGEYQWSSLAAEDLRPVISRLGHSPEIVALARRRASRG